MGFFYHIYSKPSWDWTLLTRGYIALSLEIKPVLKCQQGSSFICEVGISSQNTTASSWKKKAEKFNRMKSQQNRILKSKCIHFIKTCQALARKRMHFELHVMCCVSFPQGELWRLALSLSAGHRDPLRQQINTGFFLPK